MLRFDLRGDNCSHCGEENNHWDDKGWHYYDIGSGLLPVCEWCCSFFNGEVKQR